MLSFHNDPKIKEKYVDRVKQHKQLDEIVQGKYWENGKGCAVGCTIHGSEHSRYEEELGIPQLLARLEDRIFEGLPNYLAKEWPLEFLEAIPVGVDLSYVWPKFDIFLMLDETQCAGRSPKNYEEAQRQRKVVGDDWDHKLKDKYENELKGRDRAYYFQSRKLLEILREGR